MAIRAVDGPVTGDSRSGGRPFSILDELNCYFDSPAEPNNVQIEVWLSGHLSPERLRAAVTATLVGLPWARARRAVGNRWRTGYAWEFPPEADVDPVSINGWRSEAELDSARARFLAAAPELDRSPPFRLLLAQGPGWDSLILNAHHAAFDGRSCLRLLCLIADQYRGGQREALAADRASAARRRPAPTSRPQPSEEPSSGRQLASRRRAGTWSLANRLPLRIRSAARIAPQRPDGHRACRVPGYGFSLLSLPDVPTAYRPPDESRVTVNDLLIAALIQAIARWNTTRRRRPGRIRISMPLDIRPPGCADELGNLSRLYTITVDPLITADLTAAVASQTRQAKRQSGPLVNPVLAPTVKARLPTPVKRGLVRLAVRSVGRIGCDTSLLSNLGNVTDPPRFGMLSPTRMWFSTSAHMPRGLSVGAITVGGRLQLCFRYRNALLDAAGGRDFAAEYAAALSALTGEGTGR